MRANWSLLALLLFVAAPGYAATPEIALVIRDHLFFPATIEIPAGVKIRLMVDNQDQTPEEFESYEMNREKVIPAMTRSVVFIGPLEPGEYVFFGEFYAKTAQGKVIAK